MVLCEFTPTLLDNNPALPFGLLSSPPSRIPPHLLTTFLQPLFPGSFENPTEHK